MSRPLLSVIVPTKGRATLAATLASVPDWGDRIEVIVVGDGPTPNAEKIAKRAGSNVRYLETTEPTRDFGNSQRDFGIAEAQGLRLLFMDDDDTFTEDAFDHIFWWSGTYQGQAIVFRMRYSQYHPEAGKVLWAVPRIVPANVGSPMFSPLNDPNRLAKWADGDGYLSDFAFISATARMQGNTVFSPEVICEIWPTKSRLNEDSQPETETAPTVDDKEETPSDAAVQ